MTDTPNARALNAASWLRERADQHISMGLQLAADVTRQPGDIEAAFAKAHNCLNMAEAFEWDAASND